MTDIPLNEQMEAVRPYVQKIKDRWGDKRKLEWECLGEVAALYEELGMYSRGLTRGLMEAFRVEDESSVYNYRDAFLTRERLLPNSQLPYSYFVAINSLQKRYEITDESCTDWLKLTEADSQMSVRKMRMDVEAAYTEDQRAAFLRHASRAVKLLTTMYEDSESVGLPQPERALLKGALEAVQKVAGWGN